MPTIEHALGTTFFKTKGRNRKGRLPLVCLHGGPGGTHAMTRFLLRQSAERKVYVYDQLGSGRSSQTPKSRWNVDTFVRELQLLRKAWGLDRFHLFGASWGATLALEYYTKKRNNGVHSLLFQSPFFSAKDWTRDANRLIEKLPARTRNIIRTCDEIGATDAQVFADAMFEFYVRHVYRNPEGLRASMNSKTFLNKEIYGHMWGVSEFHPSGTLQDYEGKTKLALVQVPSLFMCGQFDEATPETLRRSAKRVRGSEVTVFRGCSHAIGSENPKAINKRIREFLLENDLQD
jgi:proline iminopeptidase